MRQAWAAAGLVLAAFACPPPTGAQQRPISGSASPTMSWPLVLPPPDTGGAAPMAAPPIAAPRLAADPDRDQGCAPQWPCRLQLFGVIQRNGGIGVKGTALTW